MKRILAGILLLAAASGLAAEEWITEIVALKHRLVGDVVPTLRELVAPGGTVTGMNDQVIIQTTADNLVDLKNVLGALDTRLRQLRITVRQDIATDTQLHADQLSARVRAGDVRAGVGGQAQPGPGAQVSIGNDDYRVDYRNFSTRRSEDSEQAHFVSTIEGQPAFINTGQSVPLADSAVIYTPYGVTVNDAVRYRDVGSGFYVTPRIIGDDGVNLQISPYAENVDLARGGAIDSRGLSTVATGRLGEWIALGGAGQVGGDSAGGINYRSRHNERDVYDVWVKVDVVP